MKPNVGNLRYFKLFILLDKIIWVLNIYGLHHCPFGCKNIGIWKFKFVAKTQFLCLSTVFYIFNFYIRSELVSFKLFRLFHSLKLLWTAGRIICCKNNRLITSTVLVKCAILMRKHISICKRKFCLTEMQIGFKLSVFWYGGNSVDVNSIF